LLSLAQAAFGMPIDGRRRWCGACAKMHPGSAYTVNRKTKYWKQTVSMVDHAKELKTRETRIAVLEVVEKRQRQDNEALQQKNAELTREMAELKEQLGLGVKRKRKMKLPANGLAEQPGEQPPAPEVKVPKKRGRPRKGEVRENTRKRPRKASNAEAAPADGAVPVPSVPAIVSIISGSAESRASAATDERSV
jgi:hypothetical protein